MVGNDVPPRTLESRSVEAVAKYIMEKKIRRIVVLTGAGISTSAGIPDFRSPDTGIYSSLARLELPYPEAVFDISYFRRNPRPFHTLARELYPGRFRPTLAHSFIKLLYDKGRLLKLFTQNIDCLEREAGLPPEMIVEAHGSFASQSCIDCKSPYPADKMKRAIEEGDIPTCPDCKGFVKPDIVFFGEALPSSFALNRTLPAAAELCIVMGTSLTVQPFASLSGFCPRETPRVLVNQHQVGDLGSRADDVLLLGDCDAGVMKFAEALGWREDLEALWAQTAPPAPAPTKEEEKEKDEEAAPSDARDERLGDEIERLTKEVEQTLHVSQGYDSKLRDQLQIQGGGRHGQDMEPAKDGTVSDGPIDSEPQLDVPNQGGETVSPDGASQTKPAVTDHSGSENKDNSKSTDGSDTSTSKKPPSTL